jgi:VanZ family protein
VIRVFNIPAITWTLTVVLLLSGSYHLLQALKPHQLTHRVNNTLHALMNFLMAAMLWNLAPSTMLAQIAVLAGAALWFTVQAVARPEFKILCPGRQGRLKCAYHSVSMGGAAVMVAMMGQVTGGHAPAHGMSMQNAHHSMAAATPSTAAATFDHAPGLAILLTVTFGAAAAVFILLVLLTGTSKTKRRDASRRSSRASHWLEALGAAAMAMMFATMSS